jgi:VWFA-related protein
MRFAVLLGLVGFASLLAAQGSAPAPTTPPTPVIKMTTRQVQVSVVVRDKKGHPVEDLKREDFVILDQGQPQEIRYFAIEKSDSLEPPPDLPAGTFSNRATSTGPGHAAAMPNALTVILLDGLNTRYFDRGQARKGLVKFVAALKPGDRVAVYTLTNQLRVLHDFTTDIGVLKNSLDRKGKSPDPATQAESEAVERFLTESISPMIRNFPEQRTPTTMQALRVIAFQLAGIPGRKNLVWLSDGFPLNIGMRANGLPGRSYQNFDDDEARTIKALDNAGVAIYPVDARGLIDTFETNPSLDPTNLPNGRPVSPRRGRAMDQQAQMVIADSKNALQEIADGTGGVAFMDSNDLGTAIRRAVEDSNVSYTISYSPTHNEWEGEFREIKLKVNRSGVEAHYRKGYYAMPEQPVDAQARSASLVAAAESPLPSTGLGLTGRLMPSPSSSSVAVRVVVAPSEVSFAHGADGKWSAELSILVVLRDSAGNPAGHIAQTYQMNFPQDRYDQVHKDGVVLNVNVPVAGQPVKARVVVRDAGTGAVGSLDLPIE